MRPIAKSRLLFLSAEMFKKPLLQTVWTQIRLLLRSSLFWVHAICFYTLFVSNVRQLFAADNFSRRHFQMFFFLGALRVKMPILTCPAWLYVYILVSAFIYIHMLFIRAVNAMGSRPSLCCSLMCLVPKSCVLAQMKFRDK